MKPCSRCHVKPRRMNHKYCLGCFAAYTREWRKTYRLSDAAKLKKKARTYANIYLKRGKIKKEACKICGDKAQMHHPDYGKPLEIMWLCRKHHLELHKLMS